MPFCVPETRCKNLADDSFQVIVQSHCTIMLRKISMIKKIIYRIVVLIPPVQWSPSFLGFPRTQNCFTDLKSSLRHHQRFLCQGVSVSLLPSRPLLSSLPYLCFKVTGSQAVIFISEKNLGKKLFLCFLIY